MPSKKSRAKKKGAKASVEFSLKQQVAKLVSQAEEALDPQKALGFYNEALGIDPSNTEVHDSITELLLEFGEVEQAKKHIQASIESDPESGAMKWMYLGQLQEGKESKKCFEKGILILMRKKKELIDSGATVPAEPSSSGLTPLELLNHQLAAAFSNLGELYMTDLCDEPGAETQCERAFMTGIQQSPTSVEPLQGLANLRLLESRRAEAKTLMLKASELLSAMEEGDLPPLDFRLQSARILMGLTMFNEAAGVLDSCLAQEYGLTELYFLLAQCYQQLGENEEAQEVLQQGHALITKYLKPDPANPELLAQLQAVTELGQQLEAALAAVPEATGDDDGGEMDVEGI